MKKRRKYFISLIIPAYKQEKTITKDIRRILSVMEQLRYNFEIILVVDGDVDKTYQNAKKIISRKLQVITYEKNHGKGHAIRIGMLKAKGDIISFIDSGMDLDPNGLSMLLEHFEWYNADIIVGSKRHPVSKVNYPFSRRVISYSSQLLIKLLFGMTIRDTQVGMKFFKRKVVEDVVPKLLVKQFAFDIEILAVSYHLGYKRIYEAPIEIKYNFENSIISHRLLHVLLRTLWDTLAIFYRIKIRNYYDKKNWKGMKYRLKMNAQVLAS